MSMGAGPRRPPVFGPEVWSPVAGQDWSYWDRWFCTVAVVDHGGSLEKVEQALVAALGDRLGGRDAAEAKLSHLEDLRRRLAEAGIGASDLAGPEVGADKILVAKARRKLAARELEGRAMTQAMLDTPRVLLRRRSRTGRWGAFSVDPSRYYVSFRRNVEVNDHISKNRSFAVTARLEERLGRLDAVCTAIDQRLGLYRAFHTAGLELQDRADDSFGNVGELRKRAWETYLGLDWRATAMAPDDYWADLCELVVWEDYGLGYQDQPRPWRGVAAGEADLVEAILGDVEEELRRFHLHYQADEALAQIGWLHVAGRRFSAYERAASRIGSRDWQPIVAMAESALAARRADLAVRVFRAADQPGFHQKHLQDRCRQLTGMNIAAGGSHLRVVQ